MKKSIILLLVVMGIIIFNPFSSKAEAAEMTPSYTKLDTLEKPDFKSFKDVKAKKKAFFEFLYPFIVNKNIDILNLREEIKTTKTQSVKLEALCEKHRTTCEIGSYKSLLTYIDVIPPSLAMAQGANESAWGTSRFARVANNYFGIWCFSKGCGVVPSGRDSSKSHEVRSFKVVGEGVVYYIDNINRNGSYKTLRTKRLKTKDSTVLATGLIKYSEKGQAYVDEIISMINYNKLKEYDKKMNKYLEL